MKEGGEGEGGRRKREIRREGSQEGGEVKEGDEGRRREREVKEGGEPGR